MRHASDPLRRSSRVSLHCSPLYSIYCSVHNTVHSIRLATGGRCTCTITYDVHDNHRIAYASRSPSCDTKPCRGLRRPFPCRSSPVLPSSRRSQRGLPLGCPSRCARLDGSRTCRMCEAEARLGHRLRLERRLPLPSLPHLPDLAAAIADSARAVGPPPWLPSARRVGINASPPWLHPTRGQRCRLGCLLRWACPAV